MKTKIHKIEKIKGQFKCSTSVSCNSIKWSEIKPINPKFSTPLKNKTKKQQLCDSLQEPELGCLPLVQFAL